MMKEVISEHENLTDVNYLGSEVDISVQYMQ